MGAVVNGGQADVSYIPFAKILLAILALGIGFYFYQRTIPAVPVTAGDLEKGGNFSADERLALTHVLRA